MAVVATTTVVMGAEFDGLAAEAAAVVDEGLVFLDGHCEVWTSCQVLDCVCERVAGKKA